MDDPSPAAAPAVPTLPFLKPAPNVGSLQIVRKMAWKWGGDAKKTITLEKAAQRAALTAAKQSVAAAAALARAPGSLATGLSLLGVASRRAMEGYALCDIELEVLQRAAAGAGGAAWGAMEGYALYTDELQYLRRACRDKAAAPAPSPVKRGASQRITPGKPGPMKPGPSRRSPQRIEVVVSKPAAPTKPAASRGGGHRAREGSYSARSSVGSDGGGGSGRNGGGGGDSFRDTSGGSVADGDNGSDGGDGGDGDNDGGDEAYELSWEDAGIAARVAIQAAVAAAQGSQLQARGAAAAAADATHNAARASAAAQQAVQTAIGLTGPSREMWLSSLSPRQSLGREEEESQRGPGPRSPRALAPTTPRQASATAPTTPRGEPSPRRPAYALPAKAAAKPYTSAFMQNDIQ